MRPIFRQRGFSLIELLVAVFVIVLLTGVVSLNVGRGGAELELESKVRHLAGLLAFASAEAGYRRPTMDCSLEKIVRSTHRVMRVSG